MQSSEVRNPSERNKLILAAVLGLVAIVFLWWTFFGFGGSSTPVSRQPANQPTPSAVSRRTNVPAQSVVEFQGDQLDQLRPVIYEYTSLIAPPARRNIFVYYEPPKPPPVEPTIPTPTPTPVPPVLLASLSPANVYARTGDF